MQTIYIDIYFLINFTVDLLSIYYSCMLSKLRCGIRRMIIAAAVGGSYAVLFILLFENSVWMYPISFLILTVIVLIVAFRVSFYRKLKYAISYLLFQLLVGGIVYYGYCWLSERITKETANSLGANNKKLLILALLVLLAFGLIRLICAFFLNAKSEISATVEISFGEKTETVEALVDSGNLVKDPLDKSPVMFITFKKARSLIALPQNLDEYDKLTMDLKKKIRVIPITGGGRIRLFYGFKPDGIYYIKGKKREELKLTLAIDTETEEYGGYFALIPLSALEDI